MDTYGMTPEEIARRQQAMDRLMATGDPTNASVAELMSHGPYSINGGQAPPVDSWSGGPRGQSPQMVPAGAGAGGSFSQPQAGSMGDAARGVYGPPPSPSMAPPGYGSGMGSSMGGYPPSTSGPISNQPSAMSNGSYPGSPTYRPPQQAQGHTININIGGNPTSSYPTDGNVTPNWTEQQYQSQQPQAPQGPSSYSRPDVLGNYGPQSGIKPPQYGPPAGLGGLFPGSPMSPYTPTSPDLNHMYQQGFGSMPPIGPVQQQEHMYPTPGSDPRNGVVPFGSGGKGQYSQIPNGDTPPDRLQMLLAQLQQPGPWQWPYQDNGNQPYPPHMNPFYGEGPGPLAGPDQGTGTYYTGPQFSSALPGWPSLNSPMTYGHPGG